MEFDVKILDYTKDIKGSKIATCDVEIKYSDEKWEIFRNLALFNKGDRFWLSPAQTKRNGEWKAFYERNPNPALIVFPKVIEELKKNYI